MLNDKQEVINAFKIGIFPYIDGSQTKKESEEESDEKLDENNFLNILRINQKVLTTICFKHILTLYHLLFWQKHYLKQKIKRTIMT